LKIFLGKHGSGKDGSVPLEKLARKPMISSDWFIICGASTRPTDIHIKISIRHMCNV